jgi:Family of unknown function (DUF1028)
LRDARIHCAPRTTRRATSSIVACDLDRREWGVAVQSRSLAIGALAGWAEPGVGAVATPPFMNAECGRRGLNLIREGLSPREALDRVLASDPEPEKRQVGVLSRGRESTGAARAYERTIALTVQRGRARGAGAAPGRAALTDFRGAVQIALPAATSC